MSFISSHLELKFGRKFSNKQIFSIFFHQVYHAIPLLKFCRVIVDRQQKNVPSRSMWLNRVFTDVANTDKRYCLTTDCSGVNKNGPGTYRTQADDSKKQVCYFNQPRDDKLHNVFISNRIKVGNFSKGIYFKINRVQGKDKTFDAEKTLKEDDAYDRFSKLETVSKQTQFYGGSRK